MGQQKTSAKALVRAAQAEEKRNAQSVKGQPILGAVTTDSFVNFAHKLGMGADNLLSHSTYGFNPITRNRILLEWIHRGSWLGGATIDLIPEDMTKRGIECMSEMPPDKWQKLEEGMNTMGFWEKLCEVLQWGRLYGGAIGVALIDGQDMRSPLRLETVGRGQFKGILPLDRWMLEPSLGDLVTEFGPRLGLPKFYTVGPNAPALRGVSIHHTRILFRHVGVKLPYNQALTENLWGISVIERLYDRMVAYDSATMGAAQLVGKAYLRTLKVEGLRDIVAAGGAAMLGLVAYTETMRRYQGQEGITLLDARDEFDVQQSSAFASVTAPVLMLAEQLSGALQIPLTRMLGQSPAGLNSTGESDMHTYYDGIGQRQETDMREGVALSYKLAARSEGIALPEDFDFQFASLWDLTDQEKAETASKVTDSVTKAQEAGLIGRRTALLELRQSSRRTGVFSNITQELIDSADDEVMPPLSEQMLAEAGFGSDTPLTDNAPKLGTEEDDDAGSDGKEKPVAKSPRRRVDV